MSENQEKPLKEIFTRKELFKALLPAILLTPPALVLTDKITRLIGRVEFTFNAPEELKPIDIKTIVNHLEQDKELKDDPSYLPDFVNLVLSVERRLYGLPTQELMTKSFGNYGVTGAIDVSVLNIDGALGLGVLAQFVHNTSGLPSQLLLTPGIKASEVIPIVAHELTHARRGVGEVAANLGSLQEITFMSAIYPDLLIGGGKTSPLARLMGTAQETIPLAMFSGYSDSDLATLEFIRRNTEKEKYLPHQILPFAQEDVFWYVDPDTQFRDKFETSRREYGVGYLKTVSQATLMATGAYLHEVNDSIRIPDYLTLK